MACITSRFDPKIGPIINVAVLADDPQSFEILGKFDALIDTGATITCISPRVSAECGLESLGKIPVEGATGISKVDYFKFGIGFVIREKKNADGLSNADLDTISVTGPHFYKGDSPFDILLGCDVICKGAFSLSFDGHFVLSF